MFARSITGSGGEAQWRITGWGWQLAVLSLAPLAAMAQGVTMELVFVALTITPCNVCFVAAAIALWRQRRRAALVLASIALASMIYGGFLIQLHPSPLIRVPSGHLGPGYYVWVIAGVLLVWTAFSSRSAR